MKFAERAVSGRASEWASERSDCTRRSRLRYFGKTGALLWRMGTLPQYRANPAQFPSRACSSQPSGTRPIDRVATPPMPIVPAPAAPRHAYGLKILLRNATEAGPETDPFALVGRVLGEPLELLVEVYVKQERANPSVSGWSLPAGVRQLLPPVPPGRSLAQFTSLQSSMLRLCHTEWALWPLAAS